MVQYMKHFATFGWQPKVVSRLRLFATPGVGAPVGAPAAPPAALPSPSPAPAAAPAAGVPPSVTPGAPPVSPAGPLPANAENIAVLRQSHELVARLGGPEKAQAAYERVTALHNEGSELAQSLGFTPESFERAFNQDPADTIAFMRAEATKLDARQPNANQPPDINRVLDQRLGPLERQLRTQAVDKANGLVDTELTRLFSDHAIFKGATNVPPEISGFIQDLAREFMKYDNEGLKKVVSSGDSSLVKTHLDSAVDRFMKAVNAYSQWQATRGTTPSATPPAIGQPATPPAGSGWKLSDLIDGKEDAFQGLSSTRR